MLHDLGSGQFQSHYMDAAISKTTTVIRALTGNGNWHRQLLGVKVA